MRSTQPFRANPGDGPVPFPASCCMYKRCAGRTIPYRPEKGFATTKTLLAVWPSDAEIDLQPRTVHGDDAAAQGLPSHGVGARARLSIATTDADHDGRPESTVYQAWANDYGLDVFVRGTTAPILAFSCGNI